MAIAKIKQWLNSNRDYSVGVQLYQVYGSNSRLKRMLADGPNPFNTGKLAEELTALSNTEAPYIAPLNIQPPAYSKNPPSPIHNPQSSHYALPLSPRLDGLLPDDLQALRVKIAQNDKDASNYHKLLSDRKNKKETNYDLARNIIALKRENMAHWQAIDYYIQTGNYINTEKPEAPEDARELERLLRNVRSNISKQKKRVANAPDKMKGVENGKLKDLEVEKSRLEEKLTHNAV